MREALVKRLPPPDLTPQQLRSRSWWEGSDLFLVVDDYDLVAGATNPLLPIADLIPQARDIGLHLILARSAGGAGRAMFDPIIQRIREMGSPGMIMSGSKDEGALLGSVKPQAQPPGPRFLRRAAGRGSQLSPGRAARRRPEPVPPAGQPHVPRHRRARLSRRPAAALRPRVARAVRGISARPARQRRRRPWPITTAPMATSAPRRASRRRPRARPSGRPGPAAASWTPRPALRPTATGSARARRRAIAVTACSGLTRPPPVPGPAPPSAVASILATTCGRAQPRIAGAHQRGDPGHERRGVTRPVEAASGTRPGQALVTFTPGAVTATRECWSENGASAPSVPTAPTDSTPG